MTRSIRQLSLCLFCVCLFAQKPPEIKINPTQISNWQQVAPLVGERTGVQISIDQIRLDPDFVASWYKTAQNIGPHCYSIATKPTQQIHPILITRCVGHYPEWFRVK